MENESILCDAYTWGACCTHHLCVGGGGVEEGHMGSLATRLAWGSRRCNSQVLPPSPVNRWAARTQCSN